MTVAELCFPASPPDRGRLLTPDEVAVMLGGVRTETTEKDKYGNPVTKVSWKGCSPAWVRRKVPHKVVLGHSTVRWYEQDVRNWLERKRES